MVAGALGALALVSLTGSPAPAAPAGPQAACTLLGSPTRDVLRGTAVDERLCGLGGDDVLAGRAGEDTLEGDAGDDVLHGGPGDDTLLGGAGEDLLVDRAGRNVLDGGPGHDRCIGRRPTTFRGCEVVLPPRRAQPGRAPAPTPRSRSAPSPPPSSATPAFDSTRSSVVLRGGALEVAFEEAGLPAGAAVDIEVRATRTTTVTCVDPADRNRVVLRTSSSATASETGTYRADSSGRVAGTRTLHAAPGTVEITGYDCRDAERVVVTLRDLTSGATLSLSP